MKREKDFLSKKNNKGLIPYFIIASINKIKPIEAIKMTAKKTAHKILTGIVVGSIENPATIPTIPSMEIVLIFIMVLFIFISNA